MFANSQDDEQKTWLPYILGMTATAALSALCTKLMEWGVDELREKYGTKKPEKKNDQEGLREGGPNREA